MEIFDSLIVAVCTTGILTPPSFLLFGICKYTEVFEHFHKNKNNLPGCNNHVSLETKRKNEKC